MSLQTINLGNYANDGSGDDLRTAFQKVNANLAELFGTIYGATVSAIPPVPNAEGELWWNTVDGRLYVRFGTAWVDASPEPVQIPSISNHILSDLNDVSTVPPTVGQALVWDGTKWAPSTITTGAAEVDFGTFESPTGTATDFGSF